MKLTGIALLVVVACFTNSGCSSPDNSAASPDDLYEACMAVFERKGGPIEMAQQMCDSMKEACEDDLYGEDCKKAQRMIEKG